MNVKAIHYISNYPEIFFFLFPVPGDDIPRDSETSGFSVECNTCWGLGCLTLMREGPCEGAVRTMCWKEKRWCSWSTYHATDTVLAHYMHPFTESL